MQQRARARLIFDNAPSTIASLTREKGEERISLSFFALRQYPPRTESENSLRFRRKSRSCLWISPPPSSLSFPTPFTIS